MRMRDRTDRNGIPTREWSGIYWVTFCPNHPTQTARKAGKISIFITLQFTTGVK